MTAPLESELGFAIIGAQKAGTTSLFEYMRRHPEIHMPAQKEIGFFSSERSYVRGWDWYAEQVLPSRARGRVCGEASVGYMSGTVDRRGLDDGAAFAGPGNQNGHRLEDIIPRRIHAHAPQTKLICVLRDPVARCLSHYHMAVLAGTEKHPFEAVIADRLRPDELVRDRSTITGSNGYVARGEYFRILSGYWRTFPAEQLMIIFLSDLHRQPAETLARVFSFVGVDPEFRPENLGVRYRQAAVSRRLAGFDLYAWQDRVSEVRLARAAWRHLPSRARHNIDAFFQRLSYMVDVWNARRGEVDASVPGHVQERLQAHFRPDSEALARATGLEVPWLQQWGTGSGSPPIIPAPTLE